MITLSEIKTLLQISSSDTSKDDLINFNIPLVIDLICEDCRNYFLNEDIYIVADVEFDSSDNSVAITGFTNQFSEGEYIRIFESDKNNSHARIESISSTKLVLSQIDIVNEEKENVLIIKADYPKTLKLIASQLINFEMNNQNANVKKEVIDDYEIEYNNSFKSGIPESLSQKLSRYRKFYLDIPILEDFV